MEKQFSIALDIETFLESSGYTLFDFAQECEISRPTLDAILESKRASSSMVERIYSFIYRKGYRLNRAKIELMQESVHSPSVLLFHGAKQTLGEISPKGSREECDFGFGFYLGQYYSSAVDFVAYKPGSSIYAFALNPDGIKAKTYECALPWMLLICAHRGYLKQYENHPRLKELLQEEAEQDLIVAPIADNKMFQILREFGIGEISASMAMHALSVSSLGKQYVLKTPSAVSRLTLLDRLYLSEPEREAQKQDSVERSLLIDSKLKLAKRTFRNASDYIEDLFK